VEVDLIVQVVLALFVFGVLAFHEPIVARLAGLGSDPDHLTLEDLE
jgi:hypothetical protein